MPRLTKIYTRTGDDGYTSLRDSRLSKDDLLVEALGTVDELNASIGSILVCPIKDSKLTKCLTKIQNDLFDLGGEMHVPQRIAITPEKISQLENDLDEWNATLPTLKEFILPRGNQASVACHVARTVCRRAERAMVRLHRQIPLENIEMLRYLNRLSDLLFVMSRILAKETGEQEIMWGKD